MSTPRWRRGSRERRAVAAAVAGLALPLAIACLTARADTQLPTPPSLPVPTPTLHVPSPPVVTPPPAPSSLPCPSVGPLPTPVPGCPTPTPAGGQPPSPPGSAGGGGSGGGAGSAPGSPAGPGATTGAAGGGPAINGIAGVLGLLAPPNVGVETPTLHHFPLSGTARTSAGGAGFVPARRGPLAPAGMAIVVAAIGVVLAAVIRFRRWIAPPVRRYAALYGARAAVAAGAIALAAAGTATAGRVAQPVAVASHAVAAAHTDRTTQAAPSAVWQRVSTVETAVADLQTRLAIVASAAQASTADSRLAPTRGAAASVNPAAAQQTISVQLENALQNEYAVFVAAAKDPAQRQALISDSEAATGEARDAVLYNLSAVTTQLAQEAAIARAQPPASLSTGTAPAALTLPLAGALTQPFGPSSFALEPPISFGGVTYPHFHTGIDIAAPIDSPIVAAADGVVVIAGSSVDSAGKLVGYGNYIVIAHQGRMITLYGHLDRLLVQAGQTVKAGQVIGLEGATGNATGPHLHFEVRIAGLLVDPMRYLAGHFRTA